MGHIIIGTAGHIDHGKSLLVKALTGTDPDRLPEEQQRHITIDLGFAFLDDVAAIIDVPGHERFVHNMVAGAATIDYAMLVIAADDGVMPQTQEHLDILRLLGIERGVIVITKVDLVESEWLELVYAQVRELVAHTFLQDAPVFVVDSASGRGISHLRDSLLAELPKLQRKGDRGFFRLPIDRAFQVKGYGTVVTGTVLSGRVALEDRLELLPQGKEVRVRGLQTHGTSQTSLGMGQRAAINLSGVDKHLVQRGDFLATPGHMAACKSWRAKVVLLPNAIALKNRQRVRIHIGTQEVMARVLLLVDDGSLADFYFESQVVAARTDRFVVRSYSPIVTIGGGGVTELNPPRIKKSDRADEVGNSIALSQASEEEFTRIYLEKRMPYGATLAELIQVLGIGNEIIAPLLKDLMARGDIRLLGERYLSTLSLNHRRQLIVGTLRDFHRQNPELVGMERAELRQTALPGIPESLLTAILKALLDENGIKAHGSVLSLSEHTATFSESHEMLAEKLLSLIQAANFRPPPVTDMAKATETLPNEVIKVLALLVKRKQLVRLEPELFFHPDVFRSAISKLRHEIAVHGSVTVGNISTILDSSRKYVVRFLEYTDKMGMTKRQGDQRVAGSQFEEGDVQASLATSD